MGMAAVGDGGVSCEEVVLHWSLEQQQWKLLGEISVKGLEQFVTVKQP